MLLQVRVEITDGGIPGDPAEARPRFWNAVRRFSRADRPEVPDAEMEQRLRRDLPPALHHVLRQQLEGRWSSARSMERLSTALAAAPPEPLFQVSGIRYGSLEFLLELTRGVEEAAPLLAQCLPEALRLALGLGPGVLPLTVFIEPAGAWAASMPAGAATAAVATGREAAVAGKLAAGLGTAWYFANFSLVLPFALALLVCWFAFTAMTRQIEANDGEARALREAQRALAETQSQALRQTTEQLLATLKEARPAGAAAAAAAATPAATQGAAAQATAAARGGASPELEAYRRSVGLAAVRQPNFQVQLPELGPDKPELRMAHFTRFPFDPEARGRPIWASLSQELRLAACRSGRDPVLGIQQTLGLAPLPGTDWKVIEFTARREDLMRPCFSGERVDTSQCSFELPPEPQTDEGRLKEHRWLRFMLRQVAGSFRDGFTRTPAEAMHGSPFTGMGWTYNWSPDSPTPVGVAEFVIFKDAVLQQVSPPLDPAEFCRGGALATTATRG